MNTNTLIILERGFTNTLEEYSRMNPHMLMMEDFFATLFCIELSKYYMKMIEI